MKKIVVVSKPVIETISLSEYCFYNFARLDAVLPNGGKITAHHGRDKSTAKYYAGAPDRSCVVSYYKPNGEHVRCEAFPWETIVTCTPTK